MATVATAPAMKARPKAASASRGEGDVFTVYSLKRLLVIGIIAYYSH
jgi:hypothetical protein